MSTNTQDARSFAKEVAKYIGVTSGGKPITTKVTSLFQKLSQTASGRCPVLVESVIALTQPEKRTIERLLAVKTGGGIQADYKINKELLTGLRIHAGDLLIDTSGELKLRQFVDRLMA